MWPSPRRAEAGVCGGLSGTGPPWAAERWAAGESWPLSELGLEPVGTGDAARRGAHTQAVCTRISGLHAPALWAPSKYLLQSLVAPPSLACTPVLRFHLGLGPSIGQAPGQTFSPCENRCP